VGVEYPSPAAGDPPRRIHTLPPPSIPCTPCNAGLGACLWFASPVAICWERAFHRKQDLGEHASGATQVVTNSGHVMIPVCGVQQGR